jgi:hypothetical protein
MADDDPDDSATHADVEASVVRMMIAATGNVDDVRAALADHAEASGFSASVSINHGSLTVVIG